MILHSRHLLLNWSNKAALTRLMVVTSRFLRCSNHRCQEQKPSTPASAEIINLLGKSYSRDSLTNITPSIVNKLGVNLHQCTGHPLNLLTRRIQDFFYRSFQKTSGNSPLFSVHDNLSPVVTLAQNFDSLLVPTDHVSRSPHDTYYVNSDHLLRAHTSAHQLDLIRSGLDAFLVVGDVYRRDAVDATHYPVFHQIEGVRLYTGDQLFKNTKGSQEKLSLLESSSTFEVSEAHRQMDERSPDRQECHTLETAKLLEYELKSALEGLAKTLFGSYVECRWVPAYFPFTHPSWELELLIGDRWTEMLGCGIIEQTILDKGGAGHKAGYAFGLGLERWAMKLYSIPDIRLFWSQDSGFLNQFKTDDIHRNVIYKAVSVYPQCSADLSFWLPATVAKEDDFSSNNFYEIVRSVAGDVAEQVELVDAFKHPKNGRFSHCYRIVYRHMERTLTQAEVNSIHTEIGRQATETLCIEIR